MIRPQMSYTDKLSFLLRFFDVAIIAPQEEAGRPSSTDKGAASSLDHEVRSRRLSSCFPRQDSMILPLSKATYTGIYMHHTRESYKEMHSYCHKAKRPSFVLPDAPKSCRLSSVSIELSPAKAEAHRSHSIPSPETLWLPRHLSLSTSLGTSSSPPPPHGFQGAARKTFVR